MITLKETVNKLTKLYSDLNDCNDGFTCSMIINDIELTLKSYGRECSVASLNKASISAKVTHEDMGEIQFYTINKASVTNTKNIVLL